MCVAQGVARLYDHRGRLRTLFEIGTYAHRVWGAFSANGYHPAVNPPARYAGTTAGAHIAYQVVGDGLSRLIIYDKRGTGLTDPVTPPPRSNGLQSGPRAALWMDRGVMSRVMDRRRR